MISPAAVGIFKMASSFVVSSGVSTMVGYAAKSSIPKIAPAIIRSRPALVKGFNLFQKIAIPAGAVALAGMTSEAAVKYSERKIDENIEAFNIAEMLAANIVNKANEKSKTDDAPEAEDTKK